MQEEPVKNSKSLIESPIFICSIALPIGLSIILSIMGVFSERLWENDICFQQSCLNFLYEKLKIQILIASLSLPISGLVAAIHRSKESAVQLDLLRSQLQIEHDRKSFELYEKHIEMFEKNTLNSYAEPEKSLITFAMTRPRYRRLFPNNNMDYFSLEYDVQAIKEAESILIKADYISSTNGKINNDGDFFCYCEIISALLFLLGIHRIETLSNSGQALDTRFINQKKYSKEYLLDIKWDQARRVAIYLLKEQAEFIGHEYDQKLYTEGPMPMSNSFKQWQAKQSPPPNFSLQRNEGSAWK